MTKDIFKDFDRLFIGFDKMVDIVSSTADRTARTLSNYPPYNIRKVDDTKYVIEMSVAGFDKQDIEIELQDNKLVIKGKIEQETNFDPDGAEEVTGMIYRGLSLRPFTRSFNLADNIEIKNAGLLNGILKIVLEAIIPEHKKPTKVKINDGDPFEEDTAEFLAEKKK